MIEPHRHPGVFIARGKEDALVTKNLVPGEKVIMIRPLVAVSCHFICHCSLLSLHSVLRLCVAVCLCLPTIFYLQLRHLLLFPDISF